MSLDCGPSCLFAHIVMWVKFAVRGELELEVAPHCSLHGPGKSQKRPKQVPEVQLHDCSGMQRHGRVSMLGQSGS